MSDFLARRCDYPAFTLDPGMHVQILGPRFIGYCPANNMEVVSLEMPKIEVVAIAKATVVGGTNFILSQKIAIYPDLFVPSRDASPAELYGSASIDPDICQVKFYISRKSKKVDRAISLLGQCTGNYAHWLTETLPKLVIVDACPEYDDLPLLVDEWIHPNFYNSIKLLGKHPRQIIAIGRFQPCELSCVIDVSPPAYIPAEYRAYLATKEVVKISHDVFPFSRRALDMLRDAAWKAVSLNAKPSVKRRLYLRRAPESCGNPRMIANIDEVEGLIMKSGFEVIDPGKMSFSEQISVFMNAEIVISAVGAALANMIFMPPGSRIIAMAPYYKNANYYYFSNMAGVLDHELLYVLGPQKDMGDHPLHRDYYVDTDALFDALSNLRPPLPL
ncbi:glycosyltransferase family 61 protein [Nitrosovibrio tenuis]|uniref:Glycosyltransferase 61 catalytic domain-containing protein n=1 Tax=Nitrosovibrio tenuis TaxID=1233 RepID=A0A1H7GC77_9PROT|nr:glycosyltransferase family 61 protein [Nitrosovibrio tenuis]SEK35863.1 Protein of unknown function [Nitrosovibrio tenuis]